MNTALCSLGGQHCRRKYFSSILQIRPIGLHRHLYKLEIKRPPVEQELHTVTSLYFVTPFES